MYSDLRYLGIVIAAVAAGILLLTIVRRRCDCAMTLEQRNLFATNFGFFTTLYTFFLGFAVVSLWQTYNGADSAITNETDLLVMEYRLSQSLPGTEAFRQSLLRYVEAVRDPGWTMMREGEPSDGAGALYDAIWDNLRLADPAPRSLSHGVYTLMLTSMIEGNKLRHQRLLLIDGSLYTPIWVIIYMGVAFTIGGFYFIETRHRPADLYFMGMILAMVIGNIFLLYELDTPFSGVICLDPDKFGQAIQTMKALGGL
ncbi:bestrophin-like domain [Solidesulfovibrio sp.]